MKSRVISPFVLLLAAAAAIAATRVDPKQDAPADATPTASTEAYKIDPVHSVVIYRIGHLGVGNFYGRFNEPTGAFVVDPDNLENATFDVRLSAEKVDSGNPQRDRHLKSPDFFNAREFPEISFRSTKVEANDDGSYDVTGTLNLHGVTKPVTANLVWIGAGETNQGYKRGFEATFAVNRSDFGMDTYLENDVLGDEVKLIVAIEGARTEDR